MTHGITNGLNVGAEPAIELRETLCQMLPYNRIIDPFLQATPCAHMTSSYPFGDLSPSHNANTFLCPKVDFTYLLLRLCESFVQMILSS